MAFIQLMAALFLCISVHVFTAESTVQPTNEIRAYIESIQATQEALTQLGAVR